MYTNNPTKNNQITRLFESMDTNDKEIREAFGRHLKLIREGKKIRSGKSISLRRLEQLSGIDFSQIHRIEKGSTSPTLVTLYALANGLDVTLANLVEFEK
ncbi:XRE family transcriptional regulator [Sphingobacterium puteale]|uniref:XRE family transcriptional regulator n=2 Tax=Sphingobacterium puteale TaxID=2420510 RepID=A0A420W160_9SPHI|nr:XRE family transcriptional regulator [Sphingobacterium puteale]